MPFEVNKMKGTRYNVPVYLLRFGWLQFTGTYLVVVCTVHVNANLMTGATAPGTVVCRAPCNYKKVKTFQRESTVEAL